jgi:hypothetical protein
MRGRIRQESTGALWVFAPVAGNWNELGYQILTHNNINGKSRTEFGNSRSSYFETKLYIHSFACCKSVTLPR